VVVVNLLIALLAVVFLTSLRDGPTVPLRTLPLLAMCTVAAAAYYSLRVI
jgi:hypothetical protein